MSLLKMENILIETKNNISILTLNRPDKHNALNYSLLKELQTAFRELSADKSVRLLIITGAGDKSFSTGVDLGDLAGFSSIEEARDFALQLEQTMKEMLQFPKPVLAAMNGYALGGGFGLASSADMRIMIDSGKIGFPAVRLGAILPVGCTLRLNALVGIGRSRELLMTGRMVSAKEALKMGLVDILTTPDQLLEKSVQTAEDILKGSDLALEMTKRVTNQQLLVDIEKYSVSAAENFAYLASTKEWKTRMKEFFDNKK
ncbi:MAG: enoyl-CoA hydratase/isomerase family protein [Calditrichaceae bacterium]